MSSPCFIQYFQNVSLVGTSSGIVFPVAHAPNARQVIRRLPFVPIMGVAQIGVTNAFEPLSIASNKANAGGVIKAMADAYLSASRKAQESAFVSTSEMVSNANNGQSGKYDQYLANLCTLNPTEMEYRFANIYQTIADFWSKLDAAATAQQYHDQILKLKEMVIQQADKQLYLPPGQINCDAGNAFPTLYNAWGAADATLAGILCIELNSIA